MYRRTGAVFGAEHRVPEARAAEFAAVTLRGPKQARASAREFAWGRGATERCLHGVNSGSTPMTKHKIPKRRFIQPMGSSHCHSHGARYPGSRAVHLALLGHSAVKVSVFQKLQIQYFAEVSLGPYSHANVAIVVLHGLQQARQLACVT